MKRLLLLAMCLTSPTLGCGGSGNFPLDAGGAVIGMGTDGESLCWSVNTGSVGEIRCHPTGSGHTRTIATDDPFFGFGGTTATAKVEVAAGRVFWADAQRRLQSASVHGGASVQYRTGGTSYIGFGAFDDRVFYAANGDFFSAPTASTSGTLVLASGAGDAIEVARGGHTLFFASCNSGALFSVPDSGGTPTPFSASSCPFAVQADSQRVYWLTSDPAANDTTDVQSSPLGAPQPTVVGPAQWFRIAPDGSAYLFDGVAIRRADGTIVANGATGVFALDDTDLFWVDSKSKIHKGPR